MARQRGGFSPREPSQKQHQDAMARGSQQLLNAILATRLAPMKAQGALLTRGP